MLYQLSYTPPAGCDLCGEAQPRKGAQVRMRFIVLTM
jgi:hypothetical protein